MGRLFTVCAGLAAVLLLAACESPLDRAFGRADSEFREAMTANPDAGKDQLEAARPDGVTSGSALTKYREAEAQQKTQEKADTIINVGGN